MAIFTGDRLIMCAVAQFCASLNDGFVCYRGRTWYVVATPHGDGDVTLIAVDADDGHGLTLAPIAVLHAVASGALRGEPAA